MDSDDDIAVAVPEEPHVGEPQSNGLVERAIQPVSGEARCLKLCLEDRLQGVIPVNHPVVTWLIKHAGILFTKYDVGSDGETPYRRLHGQAIKERLPEFGETILWHVPAKERSSMVAKWRFGVFLGPIIATGPKIHWPA